QKDASAMPDIKRPDTAADFVPADDLVQGGGSEIQKTSKTSTEFHKTENETHEVERGDDYEKRVATSETHEKSVKRSETVEIRRRGGAAMLPPYWHTRMPELVRLSLMGVRAGTRADASLFDGDYILRLVDRHANGCRWEVAFDPHCRLYRAALTAGPSFGQFLLRAALEGAVPGPRWSAAVLADFDQATVLHRDPPSSEPVAGCLWPETITIAPIVPVAQRFDISPEPTAAERATLAALGSSSSGSSSSSSGPTCGPIDCCTDCHCVCDCPSQDEAMTPTAAPQTSVPNSPMHIPPESDRPVRYGNGEITLATTDLSAAGFGQEFGHTRIFSNRLGGDWDYGNGYNWLIRQLPKLVQIGGNSIMVVRGTRSTVWFDLVNGVYVGRYGTKNTLTHDATAGVFNFVAPNGQLTAFNDFSSANPGLLKSQSIAGGQAIVVTSYAPGTALEIGEVQRTWF
ncbi:MAG: hypothetical protein ACREHD_29510, partial [Pirellulales bacterium]